MKKLLAILLAVALVMSFTLVASADEATESYTASLVYFDGDQNDMALAGVVTTTISGPGTYSLTYDASVSADGAWGAIMMYVEIDGAYEAMKNWTLSDIKINVDGTDLTVAQSVVYTTPDKLGSADITGSNVYVYPSSLDSTDYIIELANFAAGFTTLHGACADFLSWRATDKITVTFTLTDPNATTVTPDDTNAKTADSFDLIGLSAAMILTGAAIVTLVVKKKEF